MPTADWPVFDLQRYAQIVVFTGAGLSAESGVPTYRGSGGIWHQYRYEDYACQRAFERDPQRVLDFHALRRGAVRQCLPHAGHRHLARLQAVHPRLTVITQNIDGLLQRAGVQVAAELHGSLWRLRCACGVRGDEADGEFQRRRCERCGAWLRPDITWFEDAVDRAVFARAGACVREADLFVAVGTSAVVWPAAGFIGLARDAGACMVEINPEATEASAGFEFCVRAVASQALPQCLPLRPSALAP